MRTPNFMAVYPIVVKDISLKATDVFHGGSGQKDRGTPDISIHPLWTMNVY